MGELFFFIGLALFALSMTRQFMIGKKLPIQTSEAPSELLALPNDAD